MIDPIQVQSECLSALDEWSSKPRSVFSWPMDMVGGKSYGYAIHCSIVEAWNKEDRLTPAVEFHRNWLMNLDNIKVALARKWD